MTIREILLKHSKCLSPLDAEILLSLAIKKPREYLFAHPESELNLTQLKKYNFFTKRCRCGEPIAYISGKKEFFGFDFEVDRNILIPRPETELLVEKVLDLVPKVEPLTIIDIGTGSGNIIISIVKNIPAEQRRKMKFYATDISKKALSVAKKNAAKHKVAKYIKFVKSDLLDFIREKKIKGNALIVASLPYVSDGLYKKNKDALKYEPKNALLSKKNGLGHYEKLIKQARKILFNDHCAMIIEISPEQKQLLARIIKKELPMARISFSKDLSGKTRIAEVETKSRPKLTKISKN